MSVLDWLFGGGSEPEKDGSMPSTPYDPFAQQQRDIIEKYYRPYVQAGEQVAPSYIGQSQQMASDPNAFFNKLMEGYKQSDSYNMKRDDALQRARSASAAGGMVGTPADQKMQMELSNALLDEDMQKWFKNIFDIQGRGMTGESDIYGKGYGAATGAATDIASTYGGQGSAAIQQQRDSKAQSNNLIKALMTALGTAGGAYFGGPTGAVAGGTVGSNLGSVIGG